MSKILETIKKELLSWPYVTTERHRFGGIEFRLDKREMGHIHGDHVADLPFPMVRNKLVNSGRGWPCGAILEPTHLRSSCYSSD